MELEPSGKKTKSNHQVTEVIKKLKNKSPGNDEIAIELYKYGGKELHAKITMLIENIYTEERIVENLVEAVIMPSAQKGFKTKM